MGGLVIKKEKEYVYAEMYACAGILKEKNKVLFKMISFPPTVSAADSEVPMLLMVMMKVVGV